MSDLDPLDPRLVQAAVESGLAEELDDDDVLLSFYTVRLLKWGWAGTKSPAERRYITLARRALGRKPPGRVVDSSLVTGAKAQRQ